ncbi:MAG: TSUP family transporter [Gammaproteobacteria bacterium]|nr:TSUP family transporter [Gammaproteobacteria bacterium]
MNEFSIGYDLLLMLFLTGMLAGSLDAMAGGGGLLTLPMLLAVGLAPTEALATNKLQGAFGTFSSSLYFIRHQLVDPRSMLLPIALTFTGSASGTLLVQHLDSAFLTRIIPVLLIATALYFWFGPSIREGEKRKCVGERLFALMIGFTIGFYDGFFGPGAGTFFTLGYVTLMGFDLLQATAHTKILNFTSNIAALLFFAAGGKVVWGMGLVMAAGQLIGGRLGARLVHHKGARLIRPVIVFVCILISIKLMFSP